MRAYGPVLISKPNWFPSNKLFQAVMPVVPYDHFMGRLKTRDWKTRDGQKCRTGKRETGKRGTKLQDWKTRDWKTRHQRVIPPK